MSVPREVLKWILSLDLSYAVKNPRRDFANGFLFAEVLSRYFPAHVGLHSFENVASSSRKKQNWHLLTKLFKKLSIPVDTSLVERTMAAEGDAAVELLQLLHDHIHSPAYMQQQNCGGGMQELATTQDYAHGDMQDAGYTGAYGSSEYGYAQQTAPGDPWMESPAVSYVLPPVQPAFGVQHHHPGAAYAAAPAMSDEWGHALGGGEYAYPSPDYMGMPEAVLSVGAPAPHQPGQLPPAASKPRVGNRKPGPGRARGAGVASTQPAEVVAPPVWQQQQQQHHQQQSQYVLAPATAYPQQQPPVPYEPMYMDQGYGAPSRARAADVGVPLPYAATPLQPEIPFSKPRPVDYQPYDLKDLRDKEYNIKRPGGGYWELGRLGPDLETAELQAKREKAERLRELAAQVRDENQRKAAAAAARPRRDAAPKEPTARQKALQFAKTVPKPEAKAADAAPGVRGRLSAGGGVAGEGSGSDRPSHLQLLEAQHEADLRRVEEIREKLARRVLA